MIQRGYVNMRKYTTNYILRHLFFYYLTSFVTNSVAGLCQSLSAAHMGEGWKYILDKMWV